MFKKVFYSFVFIIFVSIKGYSNKMILIDSNYNSILKKCELHAKTNFDSAYYYNVKLIDYAISTQDSFLLQDALHQFGNIYYYANKFDKTLLYYQKAAVINKLIKNNHYLVVDYIDISFMYITIGEEKFKEAKYWKDKAEAIALHSADSTLAYYYSKSGVFHLKTKKLNTSLHDFKEVYRYFKLKHLEYKDDQYCSIVNNIGVVYQKMNLLDSSLIYFNEVYKFPNKLPYNKARAISIVNCGKTLFLKKDYQASIKKNKEGIFELQQFGFSPKLVEGYNNLVQCFEKINQFDSALVYNKKYFTYKDSVFTQNTKKQIVELESMQSLERKNKELVEKNFEIEKEKNKQILIIWSLVFIAITAFSIAIAFFAIRRKNKQLNKNELLIKQSLYEKELLLSEVHHRVKNNLQLVSSMLDLQQKYLKDPEALNAINNSKNRVLSMSLIHQTLYQNGKYGYVDTKDYFERVADIVTASLKNTNTVINLNFNIQSLPLLLDYAIPMGLITNELITNACKYAFVNKTTGNIYLSLHKQDNLLILKIEDDGVGVDEQAMIEAKSFGLKLIKSLCRQLETSLFIKNENGTKVTLEISNFKLYEQV
jgi:two-component sensor histidine kinase